MNESLEEVMNDFIDEKKKDFAKNKTMILEYVNEMKIFFSDTENKKINERYIGLWGNYIWRRDKKRFEEEINLFNYVEIKTLYHSIKGSEVLIS